MIMVINRINERKYDDINIQLDDCSGFLLQYQYKNGMISEKINVRQNNPINT